MSGATYLDWRARSQAFTSIGAYRYRGFTLTGGSAAGDAERIASVDVSPALFTVLGVPRAQGRTFTPTKSGPATSVLVVLSHGAWLAPIRRAIATSSAGRCGSTASRTRSSA